MSLIIILGPVHIAMAYFSFDSSSMDELSISKGTILTISASDGQH